MPITSFVRTTTLMERLRQKHRSVFVEISWSSASCHGHWIVGVSPIGKPERSLAKGKTLRDAVKRALAVETTAIVGWHTWDPGACAECRVMRPVIPNGDLTGTTVTHGFEREDVGAP